MDRPHLRLPPWTKSLSARLLFLTVGFVMLAEIFVFAPSVARFRIDWLRAHLDSAYLAALALEATPDLMVSKDLARELLSNAGVEAVVLRRDDRKLLLQRDDMPEKVDHNVDLGQFSFASAISEAFETLIQPKDRMLRVMGMPSMAPNFKIEILVHESKLAHEMYEFGWRVLGLSLVISFCTAALVYFALNLLLVRPMRRFTREMIRFRRNPQDNANIIVPDQREDEIGIAQQELANMQHDLQAMLNQRRRLAALGTAATKISHDLRNALATSMLMTERLASSEDKEVRAVLPRLLASMERAVYISEQTLSYAREAPPVLDIARFTLRELFEECSETILEQIATENPPHLEESDLAARPVAMPDSSRHTRDVTLDIADELVIEADYDQLLRVFGNLVRNAFEAGASHVTVQATRCDSGELTHSADMAGPLDLATPSAGNDDLDDMLPHQHRQTIQILITDNGPGLPEKTIKNLFVPFAGTARQGGTGLGLAIARELMMAHGGTLRLRASGPDGTTFAAILPVNAAIAHPE
ncbi:histidine kinase [Thalassospira profundimaris]|uniref:histidine kinase n=1 Tax=Thalassospira profundimaris TaxID=502049 RepID=A0A367WMX3_9PROT|nr:HAMP domain-containing sensor histidine kinase [Thalassospira profundimaris]RCK41920.1 histidine kinase [Thalassospira profundimaris]